MTNAATRLQLCFSRKQFAAACILLLAKKGSLSVDDPRRQWFPAAPARGEVDSIANLMTHTAVWGLGPTTQRSTRPSRSTMTIFVAAVRSPAASTELPAPHFYSSPGYGLLARVISEPATDYADS